MIGPRPSSQSVTAILYTFSFGHHGRYSSFHRLAHYLRDQQVVTVPMPRWDWLPSRVATALTWRWLRANEYRLWPFLRSRQPRCVHYLYPENSLFAGWRWKGQNKLVLTCHQPAAFLARMNRSGPQGFFHGLAAAAAVVVLDESEQETYRRLAPRAQVTWIRHGVDVEFFRPVPVPVTRPRVLTIGNWLRDYGCWAAVVRQLLAAHPEVEFEVVANPATLARARTKLGQDSPRVHYRSGLTDEELRDCYARASLTFLPLEQAVANNAVLESLAMGVPILATDLPAVRGYVGSAAGEFFQNNNPAIIADQLLGLLADADRRRKMGAAGRRRAETELAWPIIAEQYRQIYRVVVEG